MWRVLCAPLFHLFGTVDAHHAMPFFPSAFASMLLSVPRFMIFISGFWFTSAIDSNICWKEEKCVPLGSGLIDCRMCYRV